MLKPALPLNIRAIQFNLDSLRYFDISEICWHLIKLPAQAKRSDDLYQQRNCNQTNKSGNNIGQPRPQPWPASYKVTNSHKAQHPTQRTGGDSCNKFISFYPGNSGYRRREGSDNGKKISCGQRPATISLIKQFCSIQMFSFKEK